MFRSKTLEGRQVELSRHQSQGQSFFNWGSDTAFFPPAKTGEGQSSFFIQPKLAIGSATDIYEREADAIADKVVQNQRNPHELTSRPVVNTITPVIQAKCAACEQEERQKEDDNNETEKCCDGIIQRQAAARTSLASTPAAQSSPLPPAVVQQWQTEIAAHNLLNAVNVVVNEMIRRGEVDRAWFRVQQMTTGSTLCRAPNPQLIIIDPNVNGANTEVCACVTAGTSRFANPRIRIHPDMVQFNNLGSTNPQTNASRLHSTLLHEFRHVRQAFEECNTPGTITSSGVCTDCNNPEEMDSYLAEVEAGYDSGAIMKAWVRVYVNWDYLSPAQQAVFSARKQAAQSKVNGLFPGVTWNTNQGVINYRNWCQSLQGGPVGTCNSFLTNGQPAPTSTAPAVTPP